ARPLDLFPPAEPGTKHHIDEVRISDVGDSSGGLREVERTPIVKPGEAAKTGGAEPNRQRRVTIDDFTRGSGLLGPIERGERAVHQLELAIVEIRNLGQSFIDVRREAISISAFCGAGHPQATLGCDLSRDLPRQPDTISWYRPRKQRQCFPEMSRRR